jgi:hypothetical protein
MKKKTLSFLLYFFLSNSIFGQNIKIESLVGKWTFYPLKKNYDTLVFKKVNEFAFSSIDEENIVWELKVDGHILTRHFQKLISKSSNNSKKQNETINLTDTIRVKTLENDSLDNVNPLKRAGFFKISPIDTLNSISPKLPKLSHKERQQLKKEHQNTPWEVVFTQKQKKRLLARQKKKKYPMLYGEDIIPVKSENVISSIWNQGTWEINSNNQLIINYPLKRVEKYYLFENNDKEIKLIKSK